MRIQYCKMSVRGAYIGKKRQHLISFRMANEVANLLIINAITGKESVLCKV